MLNSYAARKNWATDDLDGLNVVGLLRPTYDETGPIRRTYETCKSLGKLAPTPGTGSDRLEGLERLAAVAAVEK